jgi:hypothetical protein
MGMENWYATWVGAPDHVSREAIRAMTTVTQPPFDFSTFPSSDGKPMAETEANRI